MEKIKVLGIWGGSPLETRDKILREHLGRVLKTMSDYGANTQTHRISKYLKKIQEAQPDKKIRSAGAKFLRNKVRWADILVIATPVHWRDPSLPIVAFKHQVLAPLEWGGEKGGGYECKGKVFATLIACDDDGAAMLASNLHDTASHMGFSSPEFSHQHVNIMMLGKSEDLWQERPEEMCSYLMRDAVRRKMEAAPSEVKALEWWRFLKKL